MRRSTLLTLAALLLVTMTATATVYQRVEFGGTGGWAFTANQLIRMNSGGTVLQSNGFTAPQSGDKGADGVTGATAPILLGYPLLSRYVGCPTCMGGKPPTTTSATSGIIGGSYSSMSTASRLFFSKAVTTTPLEAHLPVAASGYITNLSVTTSGTNTTGALHATTVRGNVLEATYGGNNLNQPAVMIYGGAVKGVYVDATRYARVNQYTSGPIVNTWAVIGTSQLLNGWTAEFISDDATASAIIGSGSEGTIGAGLSVTSTPFVVKGTGMFTTADEAPAFASGTFSNMCVTTNSTQSATGALTMRWLVNGANTLAVDIAASALGGTYCDLTGTTSVTAGDRIALRGGNSATAISASVTGWSVKFTPTSGSAGGMGGSFNLTLSGTQYWSPYFDAPLTVGVASLGMPRAGTTTRLCVYNSGATVSGTTVTLMKNEVASSLVLTMATGAAAGVQCATGSVSFAKGDRVAIKTVYVSGNSNFSTWSIDY